MKKDRHDTLKSTFYVSIGIVLVFFFWWLYSFVLTKQGNSAYLFPDPLLTFKRLWADLGDLTFYRAIGWTLLRLLVGFSISFILGAIFGILSALFKPIRCILKPVVLIMKTVPTAAVVFMVLMIFKTDWTPAFLVFLVVFPIIYESIIKGIGSIDEDTLDAMRLDTKIYDPRSVFGILLPIASPYVLLSVVTSFGLAMKVSVMSEIVAGGDSSKGIGRLIYIANAQNETDQVMALSVVAIVIIAISDLVLWIVRKRFIKD